MQQDPGPHRAKKSLGQNFLKDDNICRKIVDALGLEPGDRVVEIGPGQGALTRFIADAAPARFTAVEKDDALADRLEAEFPTMEIVRQDALEFPWDELAGPCRIVGNLPYNVGSKLIWDIVSRARMRRAVFMVQHEVALRLTAEPNGKAYGGLTVWVRNFCATRYLFKVPPTVFHPRPKVDSAVVRFDPLPAEEWPVHPERLSRLIKLLFQQRRKQLGTILKKDWTPEVAEWFERHGMDTRLRPENLSPEQFRSLSGHV
ncbi:16S rRNA (adenine(1518)-N(6)/adenine(1519)-N(6))-dimethyltransferase RsmA [Pseudodesulfovibrio sp.]|uniref:16S rRNA (adenine(1518)-N(6)/adenine(1519)-N(6))- dimethyltransferase RsmA n=1 Tax=Pseudodesulfovibrio sp. TaxID=2035812 RepID=UPI002635E07B|nr:16S rRNA (adenine(1518)-N(6)/adenine(1519)-N(6))-dimethyltransferase RsmA [Pseudodesulfovibrio sp.]MDD3312045.1 16S rRNA (adenine(1518)-N(6)/adenine(1519)-N(6))-dimethyltransferase RsmA [Pseudodesulfovibrio sp.]